MNWKSSSCVPGRQTIWSLDCRYVLRAAFLYCATLLLWKVPTGIIPELPRYHSIGRNTDIKSYFCFSDWFVSMTFIQNKYAVFRSSSRFPLRDCAQELRHCRDFHLLNICCCFALGSLTMRLHAKQREKGNVQCNLKRDMKFLIIELSVCPHVAWTRYPKWYYVRLLCHHCGF